METSLSTVCLQRNLGVTCLSTDYDCVLNVHLACRLGLVFARAAGPRLGVQRRVRIARALCTTVSDASVLLCSSRSVPAIIQHSSSKQQSCLCLEACPALPRRSALVMNVRGEARLACAIVRGQVLLARGDPSAAAEAFEAAIAHAATKGSLPCKLHSADRKREHPYSVSLTRPLLHAITKSA